MSDAKIAHSAKNTHPAKKNVNLLVCLLVYIYLCGVKRRQ
nr:MAG TPA: hypothetical protein [Caudoviricetes sp.]